MVKNSTIKEKKLLKYKDQVNYYLLLNNIKFEYEYHHEPNPKLNSTVQYSCFVNNRARVGFICYCKDTKSFGGAVLKTEMEEYLSREGFDKKEVYNEPVWVAVDSPEMFVTIIAYPFHKDLIFEK